MSVRALLERAFRAHSLVLMHAGQGSCKVVSGNHGGLCFQRGVLCMCGGGGGGVVSIIHLNLACFSVRDGAHWWSVLVFFLILKEKLSRVFDYKHLNADTFFFLVLCIIAAPQKRLRRGRNLLQDDVQ